LDKKQPVTYGIDAVTDYLKGKVVYKTDDQKQAEKDKKENDRLRKKAENDAKKGENVPTPTPTPTPSENVANYTFNPILFGFENDTKEDITLNIIHSPKNTAKPYLVTSNVPSFTLRALFEKILRHVERCEEDLAIIEQYENDLSDEDENEDANFDLSGHEHIRFVIAK